MKQVRLSTLISGIDYRLESGSADIEISGLSCDSRSVKKGHLFIAVSGNDHDGHNFIKQAVHSFYRTTFFLVFEPLFNFVFLVSFVLLVVPNL